jgi:hypothetical protein
LCLQQSFRLVGISFESTQCFHHDGFVAARFHVFCIEDYPERYASAQPSHFVAKRLDFVNFDRDRHVAADNVYILKQAEIIKQCFDCMKYRQAGK